MYTHDVVSAMDHLGLGLELDLEKLIGADDAKEKVSAVSVCVYGPTGHPPLTVCVCFSASDHLCERCSRQKTTDDGLASEI